ncbi:MAG: UDP-N-acetylmuramoyl-tripeptide--D-alanyl-D-alanine ligase, partial [Defluviitaleaceae bacterium]|nr:UDP-N-acetylmuramoyl-tripeptide--D-alanyl-D-alanine ligase [Defluviitaleaceae bacterium]
AVSRHETDIPAIIVADTIKAFGDLAKYRRSRLGVKVIGITGSNGKTSTKDMMAAVLARKYRVHKTDGNYNNHLGMPATIFDIAENAEIAVLEMGMNHRWELHRLSEIANPDYAVITNIGTAHLENLGSREEIFRAKSEIFDFLRPGGKVFVNGDDDFLPQYRGRAGFRLFGLSPEYDVYATDVEILGLEGSRFRLNGEQQIFLPAPGRHMIGNALAACALGLELDISPTDIAAGIENYQPSGRRMSIIDTNNIRIIDDCYNASSESMAAAIDVLSQAKGRKIAILGDMFELGDEAARYHREMGEYARKSALDAVYAIGDLAKNIADVADFQYFPNKEMFLQKLDTLIQPGDTVLVKASRGMKFEDIVNALAKEGVNVL